MDYATFRYYASRLGRFMTPDLLAGNILDPQSLNRYAYVLNDPVNLIDPYGLECWSSVSVTVTYADGSISNSTVGVLSNCGSGLGGALGGEFGPRPKLIDGVRGGTGPRGFWDKLTSEWVPTALANLPAFCDTGAVGLGGVEAERDHSSGIEGTKIAVADSKEGYDTGTIIEGFGSTGRTVFGGGAIVWDSDGSTDPIVFAAIGARAEKKNVKVGGELGVFFAGAHSLGAYFQGGVGPFFAGLGIYGDVTSLGLAKNCGPR